MKIDLFDIDEMCKELPSVTTSKIYSKKGFHPAGLFSQSIFGPIRTCTCACGIYWGRSKTGEVCNTCGVEIGNSTLRRKKFAKIELPFPIINPIMWYLIVLAGKILFKNIFTDMIEDDTVMGYYYDEESEEYVKIDYPSIEDTHPEIPDGVEVFTGPNGLFEIVKREADKNKDDSEVWMYVHQNLHKFFISNILVCPPEFRPVSKSKDTQMRDEMNKYYITILNYSVLLQDDITTYADSEIYMANFKNIQKCVQDLYDYIFSKFSKKFGLFRGSILGKRIDFSARAVIAPEPELELDQCSIPYTMALELFKLKIINRLLEMKHFDGKTFVRYDPAIEYIDKCIKLKDLVLFDVVVEIATDKLIMLNRQPTLHRMGLLSFRAIVNSDDVIKIHPCACEPYNADFDGDQMAVYISLYDDTEESNREHVYILNNLISPATGKMILGVNQDILLGLFIMTKPDNSENCIYSGNKPVIGDDGIERGTINTTKGRVKFNEIFPDDFPFINKTINKKEMNVLLNRVVKHYEPQVVKTIVDGIKTMGFAETTLCGTTFSLKDLHTEGVYDIVSEVVDDPKKSIADKFHELADHPYKKQIQESFPYADFINSGSRGSWDQASQLIFCRGFMSNSQGMIVPEPIKNNLVNGLIKDEFFISCYGSRKALLDVALNTAVSGYLTRKLVYCGINLEMDESVNDCGSTDYYTVVIPDKKSEADIEAIISTIDDEDVREKKRLEIVYEQENNDPIKLARSFIGRWAKGVDGELYLITDENFLKLLGTTLQVRSPIHCKNPGICKVCYGTNIDICHSKYIGAIAAQSMGEVATQLTLRTFHTGGIATMAKGQDDDDQQDIVSDLAVVQKLLHTTIKVPHGELLHQLFSIYAHHKVLLHVHFECIVAQMMRVGDVRWRMLPNRDMVAPEMISIENVPSKESFLLALAFSKPQKYIVAGILGSDQTTDGILEKMLLNNV